MNDAEIEAELDRARSTYARRAADPRLASVYEPLSAAPLFTVQEREWLIAELLRRSGLGTLRGLDILDVGCGDGVELARLALWGADPARMAGIDLMEDRIVAARRRVPSAEFHVGSAHQLPFERDSFDLVTQFTTFSSIVNSKVRAAVAAEMLRVLRPAGRILWYDIRSLSTESTDLVAISERELVGLYPGCETLIRSSTLRWGVLRRLVPVSRLAGLVLERWTPLDSHCVAVIRPTESLT